MSAIKPDFDPSLPEDFDSPYQVYADLRAHCPVAHADSWGGFWALMTYEDVKRAATDAKTFITSKQNVVPKVAFTGRRPPLHLDPPEHTPYRRALNPLLTEERIARLEPVTRKFTRELLGPMLERGHGDICLEFSSYLPVQVFGQWMNMAENRLDRLHQAGRAFNIAVQSGVDDNMKETSLALYELAREIIADRRENPRDPETDPTTALLQARHEGQPLPDELIVGTVRQVLVVGMIAPMVMVGSISVHLCRDEELQQKLRAEPGLLADAIEEFLRLYTPYRGFARTAVRDVEIQGRTIPAGEPIALVYSSANRDESVFPESDKFILNRPNISEHLAFGRGPHNCPGAALGRMQLRVAFEELLGSTRRFELNGPIKPTRFPEIGAMSVPLKFEF
ncbi:MAG: cytochrome P450 [Gammaproteobacteria bacterium]|nr:cytochrome P450 [Gammaproteobacteria bacterium]